MELLPIRTVYPLGELEMISPWFDNRNSTDGRPGPVSRLPRLLLIVAPPRSGSYLLCRQLWELGYGRPFEYCNPNPLFRSALARFGKRPWQQLIRARSASPTFDSQTFFSCKLQPYQLRGSLDRQIRQVWTPLARSGWLENNQGRLKLELVFLRRLDVLRSASSWHFSLCTGAFDQGLTYTFQRWPMGALLDPEYLNKSLVEYREHLRWLRQAQAAFPLAHRLTHEELLADSAGQLGGLVKQLSPAVDAGTLDEALRFRIEADPSPFRAERQGLLKAIETLIRERDLMPDAEDLA